jgi:PIN domain nuclease of toxin-antitoxin system
MARSRTRRFAAPVVTVLLDTHFLIWIVLEAKRLSNFSWLDRYRPWGVSPISFFKIQFLAEVGRLSVTNPRFVNTVSDDRRFIVDDLSLDTLVSHSLMLDWTRDPFDRLLVVHSLARRVPFCTTDRLIRSRHRLLPLELDKAQS